MASAALNVMVNLEDGEHLHDHTSGAEESDDIRAYRERVLCSGTKQRIVLTRLCRALRGLVCARFIWNAAKHLIC